MTSLPEKTSKPSSLVQVQQRGVYQEEPSDVLQEIAFVGEKLENIEVIRRGINGGSEAWDFSNLPEVFEATRKKYPNCDLWLFGISQPFGCELSCPCVVIIVMEKGFEPPPFVAVTQRKEGGISSEKIFSMRQMKFAWKPIAEGLNMLHLTLRKAVEKKVLQSKLIEYEYADLFFMRPSTDWERKENGDLKVDSVTFEYNFVGPNGDVEEIGGEEFIVSEHRLHSFVPDFCERHDLDLEEHKALVEEVIRAAFKKARMEKEKLVALLNKFPVHVLDNLSTIKVYPRNSIALSAGMLLGKELAGASQSDGKDPFIGKFYGRADTVI
jgi:hypothetical protein